MSYGDDVLVVITMSFYYDEVRARARVMVKVMMME